jgi:polysaccharide biosynthesis/export protein VpsN
LPVISKIRAAGSAQAELQNAIEAAYRSRRIYTDPTITIRVPTQARFVNVGGDVGSPRRVEFTSDLTVLGAINAAGGFTGFADPTKVRLLRDGHASLINIKEVRKDPSKDPRLKPGETIEVPQSFW